MKGMLMKKKFQVISPGETKTPKETPPLSNAELILEFLKTQVEELEEYIKDDNNTPLQKAVIIYCFGETDLFEDSARNFQYVSVDMPTPDFFILTDKMKLRYLQDLDESIPN